MKRLRNTTDLPPEIVKAVEAFVMPPGGVGAYDLELRNSGACTRGHAYWAGSAYHTTARPFIVVRLSRRERYPASPPQRRKKGYLPLPAMGNRIEQLVHILAHELRHLWQARVKRGRRVWGARGQFSERDADAWAISCLRRWRRKESA